MTDDTPTDNSSTGSPKTSPPESGAGSAHVSASVTNQHRAEQPPAHQSETYQPEPEHHQTRREHRTKANPQRRKSFLLFLRDVAIILVAAVLISAFVKTFLIRSFYIPSGSMKDTLQIEDRIIVNQLVPGLIPIQHGDIVVFRDPGGWLAPRPEPERTAIESVIDGIGQFVGLSASDSDDHLIKRVIGLPGDRVVCCNPMGQLTINGVPIDEPYLLLPDGGSRASGIDFDVVVPEGSLWVLGDNRYDSKDSRYNRDQPGNGFVPIDEVVGRAFVISWPAARWGWLDNYSSVFFELETPDS